MTVTQKHLERVPQMFIERKNLAISFSYCRRERKWALLLLDCHFTFFHRMHDGVCYTAKVYARRSCQSLKEDHPHVVNILKSKNHAAIMWSGSLFSVATAVVGHHPISITQEKVDLHWLIIQKNPTSWLWHVHYHRTICATCLNDSMNIKARPKRYPYSACFLHSWCPIHCLKSKASIRVWN